MLFNGNYPCDAGLYLRLSREDGDKIESDSIRNQRDLIMDYLRQHKELRLVDEYVDDGYSGSNFERPRFQKMMEDIKKRKINCIIVKDLSRFGRNYIETGRYLERVFPLAGIRFISVTDHYDNANDSDDSERLIIPFKNLINDAYCRDISIKVRSQLDVKRKNGKYVGSFPAYGYLKDPKDKNHFVFDPYAAEIVKLIFSLKVEGYSAQRIAEKLDEMNVLPPNEYKRSCGINYTNGFKPGDKPSWQINVINRILQNEVYTGVLVQGKRRKVNYKVKNMTDVDKKDWIRVEGTHDAIISKETFSLVQELLKYDTRVAPEEKQVYLFSGLLRCGDCGQNMVRRVVTSKGHRYQYYHCSTWRKDKSCPSHLFKEETLIEIVLKAVQEQVRLLTRINECVKELDDMTREKIGVKVLISHRDELEREIEHYKKLCINLMHDKADGIIEEDEYHELYRKFSSSSKSAKIALDEINKKIKEMSGQTNGFIPWLQSIADLKNVSELNRVIVVNLIEYIEIHDKSKVTVHFRYSEAIEEAIELISKNNTDLSEDTL